MLRILATALFALLLCLAGIGSSNAQQAISIASCGSPPSALSVGFAHPLYMDTTGVLCTSNSGGGGGGLSVTDQAAWTQASSAFTPVGGVFNDAATLSSGQEGTYRLTTKRAQIMDVDTTGNALYTAVTSPIPAGTNLIGKVGIDQTTPGTTNGVQVNAALPAGTNLIGKFTPNDGTSSQIFGPCQTVAATFTPINISASGSAKIITGTSAKKTYICHIDIVTNAANNVVLTEGTGSNCGTGTAGMAGGTTAASGYNFSANGGISLGDGSRAINATATNADDVCLNPSASTQLSGVVVWVQQ
jgi:hypothetical protein